MEDKSKKSASHYFQKDSSSVFDELSKGVTDKLDLNVEGTQSAREGEEVSTPKPVHVTSEKLPSFYPGTSPFSYINPGTHSTMEDVEEMLGGAPEAVSPLSTEVDRTHDAWIPSDATKEALKGLAAAPGTYKVDKNLLVMPGIAIKEEFGDPIRNLVQTYLGEEVASQRHTLMTASVTQDDRGLRQLIANGCYHAAVNLTTQLLIVYGQGERRSGQVTKHTAHSIQLWFTRIALLMKLRRFSVAEVECDSLGDLNSPDLYFQFYPELYGGRTGSMVPFAFRLLVSELPQYLGKHTQALDRLSKMLETCNKILDHLSNGLSEDGSEPCKRGGREEAVKIWRTRRAKVLYSLTRCAVGLKDFRLASTLLQRLLREEVDAASGLFSALGRLCLHLGDIQSAQEAFKRHLEHSPTGGSYDPVQGLLHSAFLSCAQNDFGDATQILQQAHKISPDNALVINNLGVSLMFVGKIREAITLVENALHSQPQKLLHEALVLNLSTMYELESSAAHRKKLNILSLVSGHKGDGFNIAALKLQV